MIGTGIGILKRAQFAPQQMRDYVARVLADGGTIEDLNALRSWYRRVLADGSYSAASLSLFPSGKKASKLYSESPTSGAGDFTVTRASNTAVRVNQFGYYQPVLANVPRINYSISTGKWHLHVETPAATNLITYPRSFGNAYWTKTGVMIKGDPTTVTGADKQDSFLGTGGSATSAVTANGFTNNYTTGSTGFVNARKSSSDNILTLKELVYYSFDVVLNSGSWDGNTTFIIDAEIKNIINANGTYTGFGNPISLQTAYFRDGSGVSKNYTVSNFTIKKAFGFSCPFVDANGVNTLEGMKLVEGTSNGEHVIYRTALSGISAGSRAVISIYVKYLTRRYFIIETFDPSAQSFFDTTNGEWVVINPIHQVTVKQEADGWYYITLSYVANTSNNARAVFYLTDNTSTKNYQGDGTSGIYICHAQLETGSVATSPIYAAVEGSSETRNADAIQVARPAGVTKVTLTDYLGVDTVDNTPADPYVIPAGRWHQIIME